MPRFTIRLHQIGAIVTLSVVLLALISPGRGYSPQDDPQVMRKLAPWVLEKTANGQTAEFMVVLGEQADLSEASLLPTKLARGRFVYETLLEHSRRTQTSLLGWLEAQRIEHRSFYIVNSILVKGDRDLAVTLAARPDVGRVEGNPVITGIAPVEQSEAILRQELDQVGATQAVEPGVSYIRAPLVWDAGHTGRGIVVGGQDTGVKWDHPALKARYRGWDGTKVVHDYNWHDSVHSRGGVCGADSQVPCDDDNHGTHTLGTVLGTDGGANQIGVAPGAQFIACRNMDQGNGTPATYLECFEFFLAPYPVRGTPAQGDPSKAPDLTTNSWSCPPSEGCSQDTLRAAVEAQRAAGIMTIVAAGNSGPGCSTITDPPGHFDASYTVGAISSTTGALAGFSSRGPVTIDGSQRIKPDITAPGVAVRSAVPSGAIPYGSLSGTSMATPHVAGAVALLWSAFPFLRGEVDLTENLLNESAVRVSTGSCSSSGIPNQLFGYGRLDIKAAYDLAASRYFNLSGVVDGGPSPFSPTQIVFSRVTGNGVIPEPVTIDQSGSWSQSGFETGTVYRVTPVRNRTFFLPSSQDAGASNTRMNFAQVVRRLRIAN
ncbi:MAG: peptidase S8 [Acidobacteria bacterium]|nr:peptidase S8 [Acidobacteriota bacterium]